MAEEPFSIPAPIHFLSGTLNALGDGPQRIVLVLSDLIHDLVSITDADEGRTLRLR